MQVFTPGGQAALTADGGAAVGSPATTAAQPKTPRCLLDDRPGDELALALKQTLLLRSSEAAALAAQSAGHSPLLQPISDGAEHPPLLGAGTSGGAAIVGSAAQSSSVVATQSKSGAAAAAAVAVAGAGAVTAARPADDDKQWVPSPEVADVAARVVKGALSGPPLAEGEQRAVRAWLEAQGRAAAERYLPVDSRGAGAPSIGKLTS